MKETKAKFLIRKYRSVLLAATVVEVVGFVVSLTDSVIAANTVGIDGLAAVGLMTPFFSVTNFFCAVINSGTVKNYSYELGQFHKRKAGEYFGLGVLLSLISGAFITAFLLLFKPVVFYLLQPPTGMLTYFNQYYTIIAFYFLMCPISCLLDNMVVSDGGEHLSAVTNTFQIIGNIVLSFILAGKYGIIGIAAGTVICKAAFIVLILLWFITGKSSIPFSFHFSWPDIGRIIKKGIVRASTFAATSLMLWTMNVYILRYYDTVTFDVWTVVQKIWGLSSLFLGLSMSVQSMVCVLLGEKNTKAIRILSRCLMADITVAGAACAGIVLIFTSYVLYAFGVKEGAVFEQGIDALRIVSLSLVFLSQMVLFFMYYFMIDRPWLALITGILKDYICPAGCVIIATKVFRYSVYSLWFGLMVSQIAAMIVTLIIVLLRYGRELFPMLLSKKDDGKIHIYDFDLKEANVSEMSEMAGQLLKRENYSERLQVLTGMCIEDLLDWIREKNKGRKKKLNAECTLILEDEGVRIIVRDDGKKLNLQDEDMKNYSFLQYIITRVISITDHSAYVTTMGYNRNEMFFAENRGKTETEKSETGK